ARALVFDPPLLLMDEPLGALDKKLREATQIELVNIIRQVGVTCVMVTHDQEEAMTMATRMAVMNEGRFLQVGSPSDLYESPATRFVADFIGNVNLMAGSIVSDEPDHADIQCADMLHRVGHGITGYRGQPVSVAVRPEKIHLSDSEPEGHFNKVRGTVKAMSYFGMYTVYHLALESGEHLKVNVENETRHRAGAPAEGDAVWAHWLPSSQIVLTL
ncbi:MAG: TOBE domain-containing protein, partial [Gammaproteobacteria bacterium]|nr:TOBE domain-containing protein [Gammaproteobacteria bacterium]